MNGSPKQLDGARLTSVDAILGSLVVALGVAYVHVSFLAHPAHPAGLLWGTLGLLASSLLAGILSGAWVAWGVGALVNTGAIYALTAGGGPSRLGVTFLLLGPGALYSGWKAGKELQLASRYLRIAALPAAALLAVATAKAWNTPNTVLDREWSTFQRPERLDLIDEEQGRSRLSSGAGLFRALVLRDLEADGDCGSLREALIAWGADLQAGGPGCQLTGQLPRAWRTPTVHGVPFDLGTERIYKLSLSFR